MQRLVQTLVRKNVLPCPTTAITDTRQLSTLLSLVDVKHSADNRCNSCQFVKPSLYLPHQQVRFRRHDRASAFTKPRPKTKKQRQEYNRRLKKMEDKKAKHSAPGARAGPRRQFIRERWQQLLDQASGKKELVTLGDDEDAEYGIEDALMEDLLGNSAHLTSQPTPEPAYLGHRHQEYYDSVKKQMDRYRQALEARAQVADIDSPNSSGKEVLDPCTDAMHLPSDGSISRVLRAFRDRNGTRSRPIGIASALEHILKDLGVPIYAFGEFTYTTLMTCCRTPIEARRVMKLMMDQQHPLSAYTWSILVDIHAKLGDFEGCANVIKEMAREGTPPTQAAYTSLMSACYKVCNDGRIPHAVRAKAGEVGWNHWQEMRIVGIEADAMAYGAIIRLCSARGQAERAINLLEEMNRFEVQPTTLCFAGALRAVARSHEIGVRFERGSSRRQLRRELFAAHHGKMTRQIVIMAENAQVEQDDSFVSALMLCAAAAGDSATAKAVFLAAEVRKMDHLRTIGPDSSLRLLRGETPELAPINELQSRSESAKLIASHGVDSESPVGVIDEASGLIPSGEGHVQQQQSWDDGSRRFRIKSFGEREYGNDTRTISALLRSCGQAMDANGIGTMWAGRSNQGYLCDNSLRLITTRWEPSYTKNSVPDELSTKIGIHSLRRYDENDRDEPRKKGAARKNFRGLYLDDDSVDVINDYATVYGKDDEQEESGKALEGVKRITESATKGDSHTIPITSGEPETSDEFEIFYEELKKEAKAQRLGEEPSEEDARELFEVLQEEFSAGLDDDGWSQEVVEESHNSIATSSGSPDDFAEFSESAKSTLLDSATKTSSLIRQDVALDDTNISTSVDKEHHLLATLAPEELARIQELQAVLPGFPISRLRKVLKAFESTLGYPSILTLVPILRESLPDHLTSRELKTLNMRNANFILQKAEEFSVVDSSVLNSMLQVKTSAGSLDEAEMFHREEFRRHNLKPTAYSDRLVLQMFVENNRIQRALNFKGTIEGDKRTLDLPSYGTILDYFAKHHQLGSAMILLKECLAIHGSAPSEKYLTSTRVLARQLNMEHELRLNELIGKDPTEWLKYGERFLKRERSKKGRRNVQLAYNRVLS